MLHNYSLSVRADITSQIFVCCHKSSMFAKVYITNLCQFVKGFHFRISSNLILVLMNVIKVICLDLVVLASEIFNDFI